MAEIVDILRLDVDQALRDVGRIEQALDQALAPVELRIDDSSLQNVESNLRDIRSVVDDTTDSVRLTASEYREVASAIERGVTPARAIADATGQVRTQANLAEADFRDVARALDVSEDEARSLTREILESERAAERLEDAARDVARQLGLSDTEANRLTRSLRDADVAAGNINTRGSTLVGTFGSLRGAVVGVGTALAAIGGVQVLGRIAVGANVAVQEYAQLEDSINAVRVVFREGSEDVLAFGQQSAESAGLSARAFQQAVVPIGAVLTNFGFDAREAADASVVLVQRAADLASLFGGEVQEALLAINSALVGQVEPLRRYGGEISQARVQAFALANGLIAVGEEMTTAVAVQARYGLILQDTAVATGDFANTSDDFANAQRSAQASVEDLTGAIGEALLPAFEGLLGIVPEVIAAVETLIPLLASGAERIGDFFASFEGGGDIQLGFQLATTNAGGFFDAIRAGQDTVFGFFDLFGGDIDSINTRLERMGQRFDNVEVRIQKLNIVQALRRGVPAVDALSTAIQQLGTRADALELLEQGFEQLEASAGTTDPELQRVLLTMITSADQYGLTADAVAFLRNEYNILNEELDDGGRANADYIASIAGIEGPLSTVTTRFTTFSGEVEDAQTRSSAALAQLAADTEAQLQRAGAAFDLFGDLPEQLEGAFADFVDALQEQVTARVDFDLNLAILQALGLDQLAAEFEAAGVAAASQLQEAVDNIPLAVEADRAARGFASDLGDTFEEELINRLIDIGISSAEARQIAEVLVSPQVIDAANAAAVVLANRQLDTYRDELLGSFEQLVPDAAADIEAHTSRLFDHPGITREAGRRDAEEYVDGITGADIESQIEQIFAGLGITIDLFDDGQAARSTFVSGLATRAAGEAEQFSESVEGIVRDGLGMFSPSRLMLALGQEAGDSFWSGFNQADLTLRTPISQMTGRIVDSSTVSGVASGGVNVSLTTINPIQQDQVSDTARMAQIASSIANTYRQVT